MIKKMFLITFLLIMLTGTAAAMTGTGTAEDPFVITTEADFSEIKNNMSANYSLANDIALTTYWTIPKGAVVGSEIFKGTFNGNNFTISNFTIWVTSNNSSLFSKTEGATIKDLKLTGAYVFTGAYSEIASVVGTANNTLIDNVHVTARPMHMNPISGVNNVSGLVARTGTGSTTIINSSFTGNISGVGQNTAHGGIVGNVGANSSVINCTFDGRINVFGNAGGIAGSNAGVIKQSVAFGQINSLSYAGGIVASQNNQSGCSTMPLIEECYTDMFVSGSSGAGGIAGTAVGDIKNSFTIGPVYSPNVGGGISGFANANITNCYSTSTVYAAYALGIAANLGGSSFTNTYALNEYVTGLVEAYRISDSGTMTDCYSWEYVTNNGTQIPMEGTEISMEEFWDTYAMENDLWSTWADTVWVLNENEDFLLPVFITESDVSGDMGWFDFQPSEPEVIYKTIDGGGGSGGTVTITETETVYVDSSGSNGVGDATIGSGNQTGFGNELEPEVEPETGFNWWIVISGLLFVLLIGAWFYIRKCQNDLAERKI